MRTTRGILLALGMVVILALPASGHHTALHLDAKGPRCSDITGGSPSFSGLHARVEMTFAAPTCEDYTYTFYVTPTSPAGATRLLAKQGDGKSTLQFEIAVEALEVCVWAETTKAKGGLSDRSPDEAGSCDPLSADPTEPPGKSMG